MSIINKLTLRHLRKNKRRTLVTIIGVIISVAMLTAVATLGVSFMSLFQQQEIAQTGEWHALYRNVNEEQLASIHADGYTESIILSRDEGYAYLEESDNEYKPYLFFRAYNENGFDKFPIELIEGNLPTNQNELLISAHIDTNANVEFEVGESITLDVGDRIADNNDQSLDQSIPFSTSEEETLSNQETKEFTIVGIMDRPAWEPISAPGYTVLTYLPDNYFTGDDLINASVVWTNINRSAVGSAEELANQFEIGEYSLNNNLLAYYGVINNDNLRLTFISLAAVIMTVIVIGSVSLIYNAFAISVSERSRHLGMLSSVGATKKQKRNSVFFEGLAIGLVSIPLGIISGLVGIGITFYFINSLIQDSFGLTERLTVVITPMSLIIASAISLLTIFISTYIPAKRASKVTAIDAIRQTMDVKATSKKLRTSRLVRKIFGIEGEFALKNLKRNKRRYSVVVFSLVISIMLFLTVSFFTDQLKRTTDQRQSGFNYDIEVVAVVGDGEEHPFTDDFIHSITSLEEVTDTSLIHQVSLEATLNEEQVSSEDNDYFSYIRLHVLDSESIQDYTEEIGVDLSKLVDEEHTTGILINNETPTDAPTAIAIEPGQSIEVTYDDWEANTQTVLGDIEVVALTDELPIGVQMGYQNELKMIVSEETFNQLNSTNQIKESRYVLYLLSDDPLATHEVVESLSGSNMYIYNQYRTRQDDERSLILISVFIYGFITLITAISVANIFNTISTSISLRKQEFAMLKSVGMTPKGFNKMINYESIFYGIKSLLYGLPISIGLMYLIHQSIAVSFDYSFELPWLTISYTFIGIFIIVGSAMLYSGSKVKKENIIDGLKQENI